MSIINKIGYTLSELFASYVVLFIIGAICLLCFVWAFLTGRRRKEREYRHNVAYVRQQHKRMEEWDKHFRGKREKRDGIQVEK